ncbi:MAG: hypothetical protein GY946_24245 [bacterium]|nr:hypothetical protein [bacterium]
MRSAVRCLAGLLLLGCSEDSTRVVRPEPGKVLYQNARIYTQNVDRPWAEALVTDGEDIVFVGSGGGAERIVDEGTVRMDLGGAFVVLDQNPFDVEIQRLHALEPRAVVVDGVIESGSL